MRTDPLTAADWLALPSLSRPFYRRSAPKVARSLLGKALIHVWRGKPMVGEIVEVEAYLGGDDPASHAHRGMTPRNAPMFAVGGISYVYLSYGMHFCMNVVTGRAGTGEAVLIRALRPLCGLEHMARLRGVTLDDRPQTLRQLASGPGRLTQALGISLAQNGVAFGEDDLRIVDFGRRVPAGVVGVSPRVGISKATEAPLRFFVVDSPFVSR